MAKHVFFSFHYQRDISRVNVVRNHAITKGGYMVAGYFDRSLRESIQSQNSQYLKTKINQALHGTSVTVVLIGAQTADRFWVQHEIQNSIDRGNGLLGIYIHNIPNFLKQTDSRGKNPLDRFNVPDSRGFQIRASQVYPTYDWVKDDGYNHFSQWINQAASIANK